MYSNCIVILCLIVLNNVGDNNKIVCISLSFIFLNVIMFHDVSNHYLQK